MYPTDLLSVPNLKDAKAKVSGWFSHDNAPAGGYKILDKVMIAEQRFVEGLEFIDDKTLIMSSGSYGNSHLDVLDLETSPVKTTRTTSIDAKYFGEGLTFLPGANEILMMTYKKHKAFRFKLDDLSLIEELVMPATIREGWGMTHIGNDLFVSDGSSTIHKVDPLTFNVVGSFTVKENGREIYQINELEYVEKEGKIYANIFMSNDVIVFDLNGVVSKRYDMSELLKIEESYLDEHNIHWSYYDKSNNVLNGIAYRASDDTFYLTGKNWHYLFQV